MNDCLTRATSVYAPLPTAMHRSLMRGGRVRWPVTDADTDPNADSDKLDVKQQINRVATAAGVVKDQKRHRMLTFVACNNCRDKKKSVSGFFVLPTDSSVQPPALRL
jgi:hypothetical protein